jgi:invasion protein IalB
VSAAHRHRRRLRAGLWPLLLLPMALCAAEGGGVQAFRDWALRCPTGVGCTLEQRIFVPGADTPLMLLSLQRAGAERRLMAAIRVPLNVVLPAGLAIAVDGDAPQKVPFHHCRDDGCYAIFPVPERLARRLRAGATATLTVQLLDGNSLSLPASLLGVTAGLRALADAEQAAR